MNKNKLKKLGILGGMGPQATQYFFQKIIENTDASRDQDHIDIVIINQASTPDRTATILSKNDKEFLSSIENSLKLLEFCNVDNIAIPCNTSHYFFDKIQSKTKIPIINMVEETIKYIAKKDNIKKIGILATDGTILTKIYDRECKKHGMEPVIPSEKNQKKIMGIIYNEIKNGKKGDYDKFMEVVSELNEKGCNFIILACTELSYLKASYNLPEYCIDALEILVDRSIKLSGKKVKNNTFYIS